MKLNPTTLLLLLFALGEGGTAVFAASALPVDGGASVERVSVGTASVQANDVSVDGSRQSAVSRDARFVVFRSAASNLDPSDPGNAWDVFLRDTRLDTTVLVSVGMGGAASNGSAWECDVSDDGRYVAFSSSASNLVPGDTNGHADVFLRDVLLGTTILVSRGPTGLSGSGGASRRPAISADGARIVFDSDASDLDPNDANGFRDAFLFDRLSGTLRAVSTGPSGGTGKGASMEADISPDGGWVAFSSGSTAFGLPDPHNLADIYVRELATGTYLRIFGPNGTFDQASIEPRLSANARHVVFLTSAINVLPGGNAFYANVVAYDRLTGALDIISRSTTGALGDGSCFDPTISHDGAFVAFSSLAANLVPSDTNGTYDVFVRNRVEGWTERVSVTHAGDQLAVASRFPALSGLGRHAGFRSPLPNIVPGDTNNAADLFLRDRGHDPGFAGSAFCGAAVNSTGQAARTTVAGNVRLAAQDLTLATDRLPPHRFGFYFMSRDAAFIPGFGGSQESCASAAPSSASISSS